MLDLSKPERQFVYQWLGALLSQELTEAQIARYQAGDFDSLFAFLDELGFHEQTAAITAAFRPQAHLRLELAADFAHSFLLEGQLSALPYLSAYLQGEELDRALALVDQWLAHYQLGVNRAQNEPSDHLSVLISLLIKLIEDRPLADQQHFAKTALLSWLPKFLEKLQSIQVKTGLYPTVVALLVAFLQRDVEI